MKRRHSMLVVAGLVLALASSYAVAGKKDKGKTICICFEVYLPGVDDCGNLDWCLGGCGLAKACYNTKTCKLTVDAKGDVCNESCRNQKYDCVGVLRCVGDVVKDQYKVTKKGKATYCGVAKNVCEDDYYDYCEDNEYDAA